MINIDNSHRTKSAIFISENKDLSLCTTERHTRLLNNIRRSLIIFSSLFLLIQCDSLNSNLTSNNGTIILNRLNSEKLQIQILNFDSSQNFNLIQTNDKNVYLDSLKDISLSIDFNKEPILAELSDNNKNSINLDFKKQTQLSLDLDINLFRNKLLGNKFKLILKDNESQIYSSNEIEFLNENEFTFDSNHLSREYRIQKFGNQFFLKLDMLTEIYLIRLIKVNHTADEVKGLFYEKNSNGILNSILTKQN